jgi:hypothetical protein
LPFQEINYGFTNILVPPIRLGLEKDKPCKKFTMLLKFVKTSPIN